MSGELIGLLSFIALVCLCVFFGYSGGYAEGYMNGVHKVHKDINDVVKELEDFRGQQKDEP